MEFNQLFIIHWFHFGIVRIWMEEEVTIPHWNASIKSKTHLPNPYLVGNFLRLIAEKYMCQCCTRVLCHHERCRCFFFFVHRFMDEQQNRSLNFWIFSQTGETHFSKLLFYSIFLSLSLVDMWNKTNSKEKEWTISWNGDHWCNVIEYSGTKSKVELTFNERKLFIDIASAQAMSLC